MTSPIHFYLTFNPHLNDHEEPHYTQAHEFYEKLLLYVKSNPEDAHLWWGKMIGQERESSLKNETFQKVLEANKKLNSSTHLYITDFNNLWVGKVEEISTEKPKKLNTLDFYEGKKVEVWFKITDFTLLEHHIESTVVKLTELYIDNEFSDLKIDEISPYTTAIRYPAFVQDLSEEAYFDEIDESEHSHLILQTHPAINNMASLQVLKYIHAYALPEKIYNKLPHAARAEIEIAEIDVLENRHHNNKRIAFSYIKAFEIIMNDLVIHHLKREGFGNEFFVNPKSMPPKLYFEASDADCVPISQFQKNYSIGQLIYFVQKGHQMNFCMKKAFNAHRPFVDFVTGELSTFLKQNKILEIRGILAHGESDSVSIHDAMAIRNLMLGIGCKGLIHCVYQSFYHKDFKDFSKVLGVYESRTKNKKAA